MLTTIKAIINEQRIRLRLMQQSMLKFSQTSCVKILLSHLNSKRNLMNHQIVSLPVLSERAMLAILIVSTLTKKRGNQLILLNNKKVHLKEKDSFE
jgi:hypothetical protein